MRLHSQQLARKGLKEMVASRSVDHLKKLQEERDYLMGLDEDERVCLDSKQLALILHGNRSPKRGPEARPSGTLTLEVTLRLIRFIFQSNQTCWGQETIN